MNKIINKALLTGDKFMQELNLEVPGFTSSACGPFAKLRERNLEKNFNFQEFRETGHLKHLYRNELGKACFAHDAAYSDSKDLAKRTISDKILKVRTYEIARDCKHDRYQRVLASMVYKIFDEKTGLRVSVNETTS